MDVKKVIARMREAGGLGDSIFPVSIIDFLSGAKIDDHVERVSLARIDLSEQIREFIFCWEVVKRGMGRNKGRGDVDDFKFDIRLMLSEKCHHWGSDLVDGGIR
jgi:hypothetical protein